MFVDQVSGAPVVPNISAVLTRVDRMDRSSPPRPSALVCEVEIERVKTLGGFSSEMLGITGIIS